MNPEPSEWMWLDARETITLAELSQVSGMSADELHELVDYGALTPMPPDPEQGLFSAQCVTLLRKAGQLRQDFDLDLFAVAVVMDQLARIEALEQQVGQLTAQLAAGARSAHG